MFSVAALTAVTVNLTTGDAACRKRHGGRRSGVVERPDTHTGAVAEREASPRSPYRSHWDDRRAPPCPPHRVWPMPAGARPQAPSPSVAHSRVNPRAIRPPRHRPPWWPPDHPGDSPTTRSPWPAAQYWENSSRHDRHRDEIRRARECAVTHHQAKHELVVCPSCGAVKVGAAVCAPVKGTTGPSAWLHAKVKGRPCRVRTAAAVQSDQRAPQHLLIHAGIDDGRPRQAHADSPARRPHLCGRSVGDSHPPTATRGRE
jgi:ribosomal protein L32